MSVSAEQLSKEIYDLKILLAEDNPLFQTPVMNKIANMIDEKKADILVKQGIAIAGILSSSREAKDKNLIISLKMNEETMLKIEIWLAVNGKEAVEFFTEHVEQNKSFNVILMNYQMPERVGSEAIEMIREYEVKNKLKPCLIIGWSSDGDYQKRMLEKGANKCHSKGLAPGIIEKLVVEGIFELGKMIEILETEPRVSFTP